MTRVKRGTTKLKRRKNTLAQTKGYRFGRSTKEANAREAIRKAGQHAFRDRRAKKRNFRQLWHVQINAAARAEGTTLSRLLGDLRKKGLALNKKTLATLAERHPETFRAVVAMAK